MSLSRWADDHFYLSAESSAIEGPWKAIPFQRDVLDCIGNDDIRIIDWIKCARIGYTKCIMAAAAYFISHKKRSGAIWQPTDSDAKEFSKAEIDPMVRDCPELRAAFRGDADKRGRNNTLDLKQFHAALLYIRGGASGRNYRRLTVDWVFYDELEGFERDVDGEGDPLTLGDARITNSAFPKSVRGSTPRLKHDSLIAGEAERARHLFRYYLPCPECDAFQALQWGQMRWEKDKPRTAHYECGECAAHWEFRDLGGLLERGHWSTEDGFTIRDGVLYDPDDMVTDWPRHIAFHLWAAYSPFYEWSELVEDWLEAVAASRSGDVRKLKTFTNTRLAEPWEERGEQVEPDALLARREDYTRPPARVLVITAAVDVQDNRLELEVIGWGRADESWGIEYRVIYGDPTQPEVWAELEVVIAQRFTTEDGRELAVAGVVLDTGYLSDHVYAFARRSRHPRLWCTKGMGGTDKPVVTSPTDRKVGRSKAPVPLFLVGADVCKTLVYRRLRIAEPGPGFCHFPSTYDEEYFRGLTAEKRITRMRRGFEVIEWVKARPRNEPLDLRAMSIAALSILNPVWDALDPERAPTSAQQRAPADPYVPHAHKRRMASQRRRYVDRWRR